MVMELPTVLVSFEPRQKEIEQFRIELVGMYSLLDVSITIANLNALNKLRSRKYR
jgi:hypothetical protein